MRRSIVTGALFTVIACSGCTTAYQNGRLCKEKMVATYPSSDAPLSYDFPHISYRGLRVVVEATYSVASRTLVPPKKAGAPTTVKETKVDTPAAVECTFEGTRLTSFRWLTPEKLAAVYEGANDPDHSHSAAKIAVPEEQPQAPTFPSTQSIFPGATR
jgi:hypothetical protein